MSNIYIFNILIMILAVSFSCAKVNGGNSPKKVLYNYALEMQLLSLRILLIENKKFKIHIGSELHYPNVNGEKSNNLTVLKETSIYNMSMINSFDNSYLWTGDDNTIYETFSIGLKNVTVNIGSLRYGGKNMKNVNVFLENVIMSMEQKNMFTDKSCSQTYTNIIIKPVAKAILESRSLTKYVNEQVLPRVNEYLNGNQFLNLTNTYFNKCNMNSTSNLLDLLKAPYTSASSPNIFSITSLTILCVCWLFKFTVL